MYHVVILIGSFAFSSLSIASSPKRPNYDARYGGEFFTQPPKPGSAEIILYDGSWEDGFATGYNPCAPERTFKESFIKDKSGLLKEPCGKELYAYGEGGVEKVRLKTFKASDQPGACGSPNKLLTASIEPLSKPAFFITSVAPGALASGKYVRAKENTSKAEQSNLELAFQKKFTSKGAILKIYPVPNRVGEFVVVTNKKAFYVEKGQWTEVTEPDEYRQFVPFKTIDGFFISNGTGYPYLILDDGFRLLVVRKGSGKSFTCRSIRQAVAKLPPKTLQTRLRAIFLADIQVLGGSIVYGMLCQSPVQNLDRINTFSPVKWGSTTCFFGGTNVTSTLKRFYNYLTTTSPNYQPSSPLISHKHTPILRQRCTNSV